MTQTWMSKVTLPISTFSRHSQFAPAPALLAVGAIGLVLLLSLPGMGRPGLLGFEAETYSSELQAAVMLARKSPKDGGAAVLAAQSLIREGRARGDSNLVEAAKILLHPHLEKDNLPEALTQAAIAQQYLHEFTAALHLLDRSLAVDPHDVEALFTRANIHLVRGELDQARADCRRLEGQSRFDLAILCDTTANALGSQAPAAYTRLASVLESGRMDPNLRGYAFSVLGEIAIFQNWPDRAAANFLRARQLDPDSLRSRMLEADVLLKTGAFDAALAALEGAPASDAILLRRAIAYKNLRQKKALVAASSELDRRFARNIRMNSGTHAREEARYFLEVAERPARALARAEENWKRQREFEDAWLLIEAANAAGDPAAARPVELWMDEQAITAPALTARLKRPTER